MKKMYLFLSMILIVNCSLNAQWKQGSPNQTSFLSELSVVNDDVIWVMDQTSTSVSYSTDGGVSYTNKALPANLTDNYVGNLSAVSATTAYTVIANGAEKGIYITTDNAENWTKQSTGFNASSAFPNFVYFWNENDGVAVGDASFGQPIEIYTTSNGGAQWNLVPSTSMPAEAINDYSINSNRAFMASDNSIYFKGGNGIYKSMDKGATWSFLTLPTIAYDISKFYLDFKDEDNGIIACNDDGVNKCFSTNNGGDSWTEMPNLDVLGSIKYSPMHDVYFMTVNSTNGLRYTSDNGQTWINHPSFINLELSDIALTGTGKVVAGGWGFIYYSTSFLGENVAVKAVSYINSNSIDVTYSDALNSVSSTDPQNYAVESVYNAEFTSLSINSITQDVSDNSVYHIVMNSDFPHDSIRITIKDIYGSNGYPVLYREPGYRTLVKKIYPTEVIWKQGNSNQTSFLAELSVVDDDIIWAMDQTFTSVSYSTDGGVSYTNKALPANLTDNYVGNLSAVNATTAYTVIANGAEKGIYITTDNAENWTKQSTGFDASSTFPNFVYFWNENDGVAVGDASFGQPIEIYTTSNGGAQWNLVPSTSMPAEAINDYSINSNRAFRASDNSIYFMGGNGIYKSMDKGATWSFLTLPTIAYDISKFYLDFKDENNGIIACNDDGVNKCFSTNNGGDSWTEMPNLDVLGSIKYSPMHDVYFMTVNSTNGLRYTSNNGQTWINHPSFKTVSLADIALTETDKLIAAGWGSLFYSTSFLGENAIIDNLSVINSNTIDIDFSIPMNLASCTNKINYTIESVNDDKYAALSIESITQDLVDNSIFHIKMSADFDTDFVRIIVRDVYDSNEYPLLFNEPGYIRTIETDFSTETANVIANKPILSCRDGFVTIEKVTPESTIKIYDVMGKAIFMGKTEGSTFNIQLQKGSIYIIQVNSKRFKVAI